MQESLTRTMGNYHQVLAGSLANGNKSAWEKEIAARMVCTNNSAESPFATVRAFLHIYPSMKLRTVATLYGAIVNGTHRPAHKVGKCMLEDGLALTTPIAVKNAVSCLCCVRSRSPGNLIPTTIVY
jgi:hypothetical protein